jgi:hypothetical protein
MSVENHFNQFERIRDRLLSINDQKAAERVAEATIESGTLADYRALARFHYRGNHPGAVTSVLCIRRLAPSVVGRYVARTGESELIGVLVRSLPALACRMRDDATGGRYRRLKPREAGIMLNREVRTISRVVIDPRYRGLGLAVDLVRHALAHPEEHDPPLMFTESLAAMGRVSPFFERAGMIRFERPIRAEHLRLIEALRYVGLEPCALACRSRALAHVESLKGSTANFITHELRRWHRTAHRTPKRLLDSFSLADLLEAARSELLCQPVYFLARHYSGASACPSTVKHIVSTHALVSFLHPFPENAMSLIALQHLHAHPANANRMPSDLFKKLVAHIKQWGDYPPLIVRPHPRLHGEYEILDGHHRAEALRQLGEAFANCEIWNVSDERATLLLLTLNRLHGEDDPQKRGKLFEELARTTDIEDIVKLVPDDVDRITALVHLTQQPGPVADPVPLDHMPEPVTFFLFPAQRRRLLDHLSEYSSDRSEALLAALNL